MTNLNLANRLLTDFASSINQRTNFFKAYFFLPKLLEWNLFAWSKSTELLGEDDRKLDEWSSLSQLSRQTDVLVKQVLEDSLLKDEMGGFTFFKTFGEHVEKNKAVKYIISNKERTYVEHVLTIFYDTFLQKITSSPYKFDVWEHYFPKNWKVSGKNLREDVLQLNSLVNYLRWAVPKIQKAKSIKDKEQSDIDMDLESVTSELFPNVEPVTWAAILIFVFTPYPLTNRVRAVVERRWIFGFVGRIRSFSGTVGNGQEFEKTIEMESRSMYTEEQQSTYKLAFELTKIEGNFFNAFTKSNLVDFFQQCKDLRGEYAEDSSEEYKRTKLENLFEGLINYEGSET